MKEIFYTAALICGILTNFTSPAQSSAFDTATFISGMGCDNLDCTDASHHHDCLPDCEDFDHHHNCDLDCTQASHHHNSMNESIQTQRHHTGHHHGRGHH